MANTKSAAKQARTSERRRDVNKKRSTAFKQAEKKFKALVAGGKKEDAAKMLSEVQSKLDRAAKTKTIHPNKASRAKARLAKLIK